MVPKEPTVAANALYLTSVTVLMAIRHLNCIIMSVLYYFVVFILESVLSHPEKGTIRKKYTASPVL
jgi:hypothetical protein